MESLAIVGRGLVGSPVVRAQGMLVLEGTRVMVGLIDTITPAFDPAGDANGSAVLLEVKAFSCNFRDRAIIVSCAGQAAGLNFFHFGSDFVGEVLAVGRNVTDLRPGDRVIPDHGFPATPEHPLAGVVTNHASRRVQVIERSQLMRIPEGMSLIDAAALSVGAQTSYSIVRKLSNTSPQRILIFGARSNTSLFVAGALDTDIFRRTGVVRRRDAVTERLDRFYDEIVDLATLDGQTRGAERELYDCVFDPFVDEYLGRAVGLLRNGGRYITCGFFDQLSGISPAYPERHVTVPVEILKNVIVNNLHIIGNCLGSTGDLAGAVADCGADRLAVPMDSTFSGSDGAGFVERTFNAPDRLGKVVYLY